MRQRDRHGKQPEQAAGGADARGGSAGGAAGSRATPGSPGDLLRGMAAGCVLLLGVGAIVWLSRGGGASLASLGGGTGSKQGSGGPRVFTQAELQAEGSGASGKLMLAILGEVYDVSAGTEFYADGQGYNCFVGRDASRAFVTGEFEGAGLTNNVEGLEPGELDGILHWRGFYRDSEKYSAVGVVAGPFYDADGERVPGVLDSIEERVAEWKAAEAATKEAFPPCNSKWTQASGSYVWCTSKSGGTERCARLSRVA
jgi:predicted heme/steroid binding protein